MDFGHLEYFKCRRDPNCRTKCEKLHLEVFKVLVSWGPRILLAICEKLTWFSAWFDYSTKGVVYFFLFVKWYFFLFSLYLLEPSVLLLYFLYEDKDFVAVG